MAYSKYHVGRKVNREYKGITYDSTQEMEFYRDYLEPKLESGEITDVQRQVKYVLQPEYKHDGKKVREIDYVADYVVTDAKGQVIVYDVKGYADAQAKLKRKMFWYVYPDLPYIWVAFDSASKRWTTWEDARKKANRRRAMSKAKAKKTTSTEE